MAFLESIAAFFIKETAKITALEPIKQIAEKLGTSATEGLKANEHILRQASQPENFRVGELSSEIFDKESAEIAEAEARNSLLEKLGESPSSFDLNEAMKVADDQALNEGQWVKSVSEFGLEDRILLKEETGWSDEIVECVDSREQASLYKDASLFEQKVNGRACLCKEIDWTYVDEKSDLTNYERCAKGWSPIDSVTGEKIELHHMGQRSDSPFAELCENSEHGDGKHSILHDNKVESWRRLEDPSGEYRTLGDRYNNYERSEHWKSRANEYRASLERNF